MGTTTMMTPSLGSQHRLSSKQGQYAIKNKGPRYRGPSSLSPRKSHHHLSRILTPSKRGHCYHYHHSVITIKTGKSPSTQSHHNQNRAFMSSKQGSHHQKRVIINEPGSSCHETTGYHHQKQGHIHQNSIIPPSKQGVLNTKTGQ